ncbi:MAG: iron-only hydrogenase system regulator [Absicoccus porci]|jgi:putative iron-only hydrogenase system regulator|uniref:CopG family transcriptional regulator n=1 Tax=Absicoccus porci TaxID=2486576 RepID=A0A3N0I268_9FIRM|nr:TM1266 family iron-only hydrogenase system putative regulator [Absicoccus porci]MCI6087329.1 iron-only hydrogenase system regulator [Absicoccus porci]MDD6460756.1 iron-only hydrogenase system regulator [Absicoccus porci]MDD7330471.1 iron-only hydrogenase system regulator [Absicoccus porci]MDY4739320.1 TM1266 family iron-only hydrogenase system putative regulator [Absicoccus porci]MEE1354089.1 TM1266 family iron-only hydrogenase system putative regulator [Absicoccus porci]
MENKRLGVIAIVIEDLEQAEQVNALIHEYNDLMVGRMGIPYKERNISVISLMVDGTTDRINALTGKLGRIEKVQVKSMLTKV